MSRAMAAAKAAGFLPSSLQSNAGGGFGVGLNHQQMAMMEATRPRSSPDPARRGLMDPGYCLEFRRSIGGDQKTAGM